MAGDRALPVVRELAALGDVSVELFTVASPLVGDSAVEAHELSRRAAANGWPADSYAVVHSVDPARTIVDHVRGRDDVLLVMATSASPAVTARYLGSVTEDVLSLIDQPLLLIGPHVPATLELDRPTLVVCVDDTEVAEAAVPAIVSWVRTFHGARPWIAQVLPADGNAREWSHVRNLATRLSSDGIAASWEVLHGVEPETWLVEFADHLTDPVFVATSVRWTDSLPHRHSTTRDLVHRSSRPVLVVPARPHPAGEGSPGVTTTEVSRAIVTRMVANSMITGDVDAAMEAYAPGVIYHNPMLHHLPAELTALDAIRRLMNASREAFPDLTCTINVVLADGDKVAVLYTWTGTHRGSLGDLPPTGRTVTSTGAIVCRVADGRIAEQWDIDDRLDVMQQLDLLNPPLIR
jgi:steroid delta-isomerase-like uncharacterized protein